MGSGNPVERQYGSADLKREHVYDSHRGAVSLDSRAKAVARLLEQKGISRDRMKIQSFGSSHPYRYNKPASPKDRRVEIIPD